VAISLAIRDPDGQVHRAEFDSPKVTIGTDPLCDIPLDDPGVEAEQALLVARGEDIELFDIGQKGGVLLNGAPVRHATLKLGDEIWVGGTVLSLAGKDEEAVRISEGMSTVQAELKAPSKPAIGVEAPAPEQRFALLDEVRRLINSIGSDEDIFEAILDTLFSSVAVRRGFIAITDKSGELDVKSHRSREQAAVGGGPIEVSRTLVGKVLESGNAVLTSDAEADPDFSAAQSIHRLRIKAAICVPLTLEGKVIGLIYGDNRERPGALKKEHLPVLSALASVAAVAVEKFRLLGEYNAKLKLEQALSIARAIQRNFIPTEAPDTGWLDVWGRSDSCDETGGDYYDFFQMGDQGFGVVIADVTGHGVGPALLMATVRASLRALVRHEPSLEKLVFRLNNLIREDVNDGRFITLFMGHFDASERRFRHVGAGHTPPIWFRVRDGSTHEIRSKGPPLGIVQGMEFQEGTGLPLEYGDVLLFTTDGIMEAAKADGAQFGMARLREVLAEKAGAEAREIVEAVILAVDTFTGNQALRDDATLVVVKVR
jgi:sigma-B regulation protein RsbU (phosphoserine phosphatase)